MERIKKEGIEFTHYEGDRVEIRPDFMCGVITLWKPGRYVKNQDGAYASPVISWGQPDSNLFDMHDIQEIMKALEFARQLLNNGGGVQIPEDFRLTKETVPYEKRKTSPAKIPTKEITRYAVYEMENGNKFIFLGKGIVKRYEMLRSDWVEDNRCGSYFCWVELGKEPDISELVQDGTLLVDTWKHRIDTTSTMRRFVKKIADLPYTSVKEFYGDSEPVEVRLRLF